MDQPEQGFVVGKADFIIYKGDWTLQIAERTVKQTLPCGSVFNEMFDSWQVNQLPLKSMILELTMMRLRPLPISGADVIRSMPGSNRSATPMAL